MHVQDFLDRYRDDVLRLADLPLRDLLGSRAVHQLIQQIEADEFSAALMPPRRDMVRGEDAFWFCVMQLDEFGAVDWPNAIHEPFLHQLHDDLKRAADCLSRRRDLPEGMTVQWMDEGDADDWESDEPGGSSLDNLFVVRQLDPAEASQLMRNMAPDSLLDPSSAETWVKPNSPCLFEDGKVR